ncbi:hypothetical protein ACWCQW_37380 [Streptomyces mirabilis]
MAQDVFVPGDELQQAQQMLNLIHDQIDIGRNNFDFDAAFGRELSHGAAQNFEKKWNDGKQQLKKQITGIGDAIGDILDSMNKTDQDAVSNLDN